MSNRALRIVTGALVAAAVAALPYVLLYSTVWNESRRFDDDWPFPIVFFAAPFLGSFVFALITTSLAHMSDQLTCGIFAFLISLPMAGAWGSQARDEGGRYAHFSFGWAFSTGIAFLALALIGALAGVALSRFLSKTRSDSRRHLVRPWQVGTGLAVLELATVGLLIAVSL